MIAVRRRHRSVWVAAGEYECAIGVGYVLAVALTTPVRAAASVDAPAGRVLALLVAATSPSSLLTWPIVAGLVALGRRISRGGAPPDGDQRLPSESRLAPPQASSGGADVVERAPDAGVLERVFPVFRRWRSSTRPCVLHERARVREVWQWGEPPVRAGLARDAVELRWSGQAPRAHPPDRGHLLPPRGVAAYQAACAAHGPASSFPCESPSGGDFRVQDLDGNVLASGTARPGHDAVPWGCVVITCVSHREVISVIHRRSPARPPSGRPVRGRHRRAHLADYDEILLHADGRHHTVARRQARGYACSTCWSTTMRGRRARTRMIAVSFLENLMGEDPIVPPGPRSAAGSGAQVHRGVGVRTPRPAR
jgi:hypothetical protein